MRAKTSSLRSFISKNLTERISNYSYQGFLPFAGKYFRPNLSSVQYDRHCCHTIEQTECKLLFRQFKSHLWCWGSLYCYYVPSKRLEYTKTQKSNGYCNHSQYNVRYPTPKIFKVTKIKYLLQAFSTEHGLSDRHNTQRHNDQILSAIVSNIIWVIQELFYMQLAENNRTKSIKMTWDINTLYHGLVT